MRKSLLIGISFLAVLSAVALWMPRATQAQNPNLLANPGFEGGYYNQDGIPEIAVPLGWRMHWLDNQPFAGSEGLALRPETVVWNIADAPVSEQSVFWRDGSFNVKIFKGGGPMYAAMSQDINLQRGARYRLTAPVFADIVGEYTPQGKVAPGNPNAGGVRLGAGPRDAGWRNANAINYSAWFTGANTPNFFLNMLNYSFDFTATSNQMTVWVEMYAALPLPNNGFFIDGLSLVKIGEPPAAPTATPNWAATQTAEAPTPNWAATQTSEAQAQIVPTETPDWNATMTAEAQVAAPVVVQPVAPVIVQPAGGAPANSAPQASAFLPPTSTPDANGVIYSVVGAGDSVWSIAAKAGITLDQILEYNNMPKNEVIFIGQGDLLIVGYAEAPQPEAEVVVEESAAEDETEAVAIEEDQPAAEVEAVAAVEVTPEPTAVPTSSEICLMAFDDLNQNAAFDADEPLRADVAITVLNDDGVVSNYVTTASDDGFCISGLASGAYRVTRSKLPNEVLTTGGEAAISLSDGATVEVAFGSYTAAEVAVAEAEVTAEKQAATGASDADVAQAAQNTILNEPNPTTGILVAVVIAAVLLLVAVLVIILSRRSS